MKLLDGKTFEEQGGLTIGIGAKHCLYTLRSEYWDTIGVSSGDGREKVSMPIRRSCHIRNLGKDWGEVAHALPGILKEQGYGEGDNAAIYVPGHCDGRLDPNKAPDPTFIPTEEIPFGKYEGSTISDIKEKDPKYLYYLAENYAPNEERARGRWMAFLRDTLAPDLKVRADGRAAEKAKRMAEAEVNEARCAPLAQLLRALSRGQGDFCDAMAKHFEEGSAIEDLSPNAARIVESIYAKERGGRRGSRAYDAASSEFTEKFLKPDEEMSPPEPVARCVRPLPTPAIAIAPAPSHGM